MTKLETHIKPEPKFYLCSHCCRKPCSLFQKGRGALFLKKTLLPKTTPPSRWEQKHFHSFWKHPANTGHEPRRERKFTPKTWFSGSLSLFGSKMTRHSSSFNVSYKLRSPCETWAAAPQGLTVPCWVSRSGGRGYWRLQTWICAAHGIGSPRE